MIVHLQLGFTSEFRKIAIVMAPIKEVVAMILPKQASSRNGEVRLLNFKGIF